VYVDCFVIEESVAALSCDEDGLHVAMQADAGGRIYGSRAQVAEHARAAEHRTTETKSSKPSSSRESASRTWLVSSAFAGAWAGDSMVVQQAVA
jgi:hypothetical protein